MTVPEFAERHGLDPNIEDRGGWLPVPALSSQSLDVLAAITRTSRERIMATRHHCHCHSNEQATYFCQCARSVILNLQAVTAPMRRWEWPDKRLSACPIHKEAFGSLQRSPVPACGTSRTDATC
jgi:hypothetical protein